MNQSCGGAPARMPTLSIFKGDAEETTAPVRVGPKSTLREAFMVHVLPELGERAVSTVEEYWATIRHWESLADSTDDSVRSIDANKVKAFRDLVIKTPYKRGKSMRTRAPATVNKILRTLSAIIRPLWPPDSHNPGGKGLIPLFKFPPALKKKRQLPFIFSRPQLSSLYLACTAAKPTTGHRSSHLYNATLWRTALVLGLNVGPRTWDLFALKWSDIRWDDYKYGSVFFTSQKTGKSQRVPMKASTRRHLEHVRSLNLDNERIFPGFTKNAAFYRAWRRICAKAGVSAPFEAMRKTCNTLCNDVADGVGAFVLGHALRGVNAESYDNPTSRVLNAIYRLKLPAEFRRGATLLAK